MSTSETNARDVGASVMRTRAPNASQRTSRVRQTSYDAWRRAQRVVYVVGDERYAPWTYGRTIVLRSLTRFSACLVFERGRRPDPSRWR